MSAFYLLHEFQTGSARRRIPFRLFPETRPLILPCIQWPVFILALGMIFGTRPPSVRADVTSLFTSEEFTSAGSLALPILGENAFFGTAVSVSGDILAVGMPRESSGPPSPGRVYLFERDGGDSNHWDHIKTLVSGQGAVSDDFGRAVAASTNYIAVGVPLEKVGGLRKGAVYIFECNAGGANHWGLATKLVVEQAPAGSAFGTSVAINGDLLVVGAPSEEIANDAGLGAVYLYQRRADETNHWTLLRKLLPSDGFGGGYFGDAVATSGDVLVVGASAGKVGTYTVGTGYVFERNQGGADNWGQIKKIQASDPKPSDLFGASVAVNGDTILVGAPHKDSGTNRSLGAVYVFQRLYVPRLWSQVAKVLPVDQTGVSRFGWSVAVSGDVGLVGSLSRVGDHVEQGTVYLLYRHAHIPYSWEPTQRITLAEGADGDQFGWAVAMSDGVAAVGARYQDTDSVSNEGAVHLFTYSAKGISDSPLVTLTPPGVVGWDDAPTTWKGMGTSIALSGDQVLVSVPADDVGTNYGQGSVRLFSCDRDSENRWAQSGLLLQHPAEPYQQFGSGLAATETIAVVGAPGADESTGAAWIFERPPGGAWIETAKLTASDGTNNDQFGVAVAVSGQVVAVGARYTWFRPLEYVHGAVYLFGREPDGSGGWVQLQKLTADGATGDDQFATVLAMAGSLVAVGAPYTDIGAEWSGEGAVYLFNAEVPAPGAWRQIQRLTAAEPLSCELFGSSLALTEDLLVVGAPFATYNDLFEQGVVYVFERSGTSPGNWVQTARLTAPQGIGDETFGYSVAIYGDLIAVGAPRAWSDLEVLAAVHIFKRKSTHPSQWEHVQVFTSSVMGDSLGWSLAMNESLLVAGKPDSDDAATDAGSAVLFYRSGLRWSSPQRNGGVFSVNLFGSPGAILSLQVSSDLIHWMPFLDVTLSGSASLLTWPFPTNIPHAFYRARRGFCWVIITRQTEARTSPVSLKWRTLTERLRFL
jgi:hypothetical protein